MEIALRDQGLSSLSLKLRPQCTTTVHGLSGDCALPHVTAPRTLAKLAAELRRRETGDTLEGSIELGA